MPATEPRAGSPNTTAHRVPLLVRGELRWLALAAAAYFVLTAAIFRPTPERLAGRIVSDAGDPLFNVCVMEWVAASARRGFGDLWSPPFYYPTRGVLSLSDHMIGPGLLAALLPSDTPRGLLVYNLLVLLSFPLGATFTAFVLRRTGLPPFAAFLGGLAFGFSPYRWSRLSHAQVLLAQWIPLLLWSWDRLLAAPRPRRAVAFAAVYVLHVTGGAYLAYMAHIPLAIIALVRLRQHGRALWQRDSRRVLLATAAVCAATAVAIFGPYLYFSQRLGLTRSLRETLEWGGTLVSYLTPPWNAWYAGPWLGAFHRGENELFAGFLPTALAAVGLAVLAGRVPAPARAAWQRAVLALLLLGGLAALLVGDLHTLTGVDRVRIAAWDVSFHRYKGPGWLLLASGAGLLWLRRRWRPAGGSWLAALSTWERGLLLSAGACALLTLPVAFLPLRSVLPGLSGMRVPPRFYPFVSLGIAYLVAVGVAAVLATAGRRGRLAVGGALGLLLCAELVPRSPGWDPVVDPRKQTPGVQRWLAAHGAEVGAYVELPFADDSTEILGMYRQTVHRVPMVNGYSGYYPRRPRELRECCTSPPIDAEHVRELAGAGVTHLVVSEWKMRPGEDRAWRRVVRQLVRQRIAEVRIRQGVSAVLAILPAEQWRLEDPRDRVDRSQRRSRGGDDDAERTARRRRRARAARSPQAP